MDPKVHGYLRGTSKETLLITRMTRIVIYIFEI
jgi:hypothetical protein